MDSNIYQQHALRTANEKCRNIINCALGLAGESGEFVDHVKKHLYHGHELDKSYLKKELGDQLWYIAVASELLGYTLGEVMSENVEKLKKRYPDGFDAEKSINRQE